MRLHSCAGLLRAGTLKSRRVLGQADMPLTDVAVAGPGEQGARRDEHDHQSEQKASRGHLRKDADNLG